MVECKCSVADFYADRRKYMAYEEPEYGWRFPAWRITQKEAVERNYRAIDLPRMGDYRFFMCEPDVLTEALVAKHCVDHGLIYVLDKRRIKIVIPAPRRTLVDKDAEIRYLRFAIINNKTPVLLGAEDASREDIDEAMAADAPQGSGAPGKG